MPPPSTTNLSNILHLFFRPLKTRLVKLKKKLGFRSSKDKERGQPAQQSTTPTPSPLAGPTEVIEISNEHAPISDLWTVANGRLREEDEELVIDYEAKLSKREQMDTILRKR
ncbi:hypothetical protein B0T10DRAFT_462600 [Thelonectria olida]|uniref:Uncharacterized protein n=1 Tax=Thelonectria olida TaxID=1576542 RepID=A0A9P8VZ83_9HYPO|nr:hypothetical protein B0T10DRAFT_462600 [Thelonectria olida]